MREQSPQPSSDGGDENVQERGKLSKKDRRSTATDGADVTKKRETWNAWKYRELAGREKEDEKVCGNF